MIHDRERGDMKNIIRISEVGTLTLDESERALDNYQEAADSIEVRLNEADAYKMKTVSKKCIFTHHAP